MKHIFACIDGSPSSEAVCDAGAWVSQRVGRKLILLHVLDKKVFPTRTDLSGNLGVDTRDHLLDELAELDARRSKLALEAGKRQLQVAVARVKTKGVDSPETLQRHGHFVESLAELQEDTRLLVLGRQGEAHDSGEGIGSNLENVIRTLSCRILITPPDFIPPKKVLLAYDASPTAKKVLYIVSRSPLFKGIPIHLLIVGESSEEKQRLLDEAREQLEKEGHAGVITALKPGEVEETMLGYLADEELDMIIMGAYGHSRIRQFLVGSTTTNLLRKSPVPILLMRQ
ncbi:nucleotide-binding universal stress UspA family protein [Natronospira proteinivora]|uniref:Nucleotide-binding universal stress UspA family protein n=1 Tax=Natronospira proteinivora TaxID=1807133 RepID=A0ABT1G7X6_9GAMM|nr:universal stress protein [Natronospira proteinivora]MCP1727414.1 nucleotide-binding universal stress UspA family protein [Natronospira proteinivora]